MLTNDAANRLDAINDAMALVTLMDELIGARKPGGQIDLSDTAASGLSLVLGHVVEVLQDAHIGLHKARDEIAAAGSDYSNETYRPGPATATSMPSRTRAETTPPTRPMRQMWRLRRC